jgi:phosphoethanolamine N-methyltransferase
MGQEIEYHDAMIKMLELIWGEGYMAPGGPEKIDELVQSLELRGKRVLDIGSGLGGPAFHLAKAHGAHVTGVDIEQQLIELSKRSAAAKGLQDQVEFLLVKPGPLPFADAVFDVVTSSGAFTQIPDKENLFADCFRVLKPGGVMRNLDWTTSADSPSDDMLYFFEMEGLTYVLENPERYAELLRSAGFTGVTTEDDTRWYRRQSREEYELIKGDLYPTMLKLLGRKDADHFVEDWRSMVVVFEKGELTLTFCRSEKPG